MNDLTKSEVFLVPEANRDAFEGLLQECEARIGADRLRLDDSYMLDLIRVLLPHPNGVRRWSIMRAIRKSRESTGQPIPHKIEDAVQRVFLQRCVDSEMCMKQGHPEGAALFHWPLGKAGGLWAVHPERAEVWLTAMNAEP